MTELLKQEDCANCKDRANGECDYHQGIRHSNEKFADFLEKAKSLARVYDKDGELYALIKEKIRELTEGEDK